MAAEYCYRTAITRLRVDTSDRRLLERTIDEFRDGCQLAVERGFPGVTEKQRLQSLAYDDVRDATALKSQHAILATHRAAEAIAGVRDSWDEGQSASKPEFTSPTIPYDDRTMTLFDDGTVSLTTVESRVRPELALPEDEDGYQYQYLEDDRWSVTESSLTIRDGEFYLHLGFRRPTEATTAEDGTVLGVDFGIENIAVTSTARFFSGRELAHEQRQFEQRRASLQQTGTRSAHRTLQQVAGREVRRHRQRLHEIANGIVEEALSHDCSVIAVEELTGIHDELPEATWFHRWAFRRLREYLRYKAEASDIEVVSVEPRNTSKACSDCGHVADSNRPSRDHFRCVACGSEANADYNAAKNIALRHVRRGPQSSRRTGTRQCALKSGIVTANGTFVPR
ncbi:RNA-guided endonuclease InsQ/TnpB family protein [Haloglomus halophilum]|uniref:RNA-guided endonuclease InsQ/TnpB family protein n=1 Tax=Haloglomus halophilum TaxID=2962672 RepID=UPI0020C9E4E2|nr:transposase [Haloglomus halophilum]